MAEVLRLPGVRYLNSFELLTWFSFLLSLSGDIETNPGPSSTSTEDDMSVGTEAVADFSLFKHNLSVMHYNVQSFLPKMNQLNAELSYFDVLTFSETWLSPDTLNTDILFHNFHPPFRNDRRGDRHGGVIMYVKNSIPVQRRSDLEPVGLECVWCEIRLNARRLLIGVFYRPPNSSSDTLRDIERSIDLAVDSNIDNIIVTGDLNLNYLSEGTKRKLDSVFIPYGFQQIVSEPTHFTDS